MVCGLPKYVGDGARSRGSSPKLQFTFAAAFKVKRTLLVGGDGISVEDFLGRSVSEWLAS